MAYMRDSTGRRLDTFPVAQAPGIVPTAVPAAPTFVTAQANNGQARVRWTPQGDAALVTSYVITASTGETATVTAPARSGVVTGLANGTTRTFTVKAVNAAGQSVASTVSNSVTPSTDPGGLGIQGCAAWWAADALTGLADGATATTWPDSSGNGFTAAKAPAPYTTTLPTYKASWTNSKPALTFDGSQMTYLTALTQAFIGARCTIFFVADITANSGGRRILSNQLSGNDSVNNLIDTNSLTWRVIFAGAQGNTPATSLNSPAVVSITSPGYEYVNGTKNAGSWVTGAPATTAPWWIGSLAANSQFPGHIAEIIFYSGTLTDAQRHQVEAYLGTKYAITMAVQ